MKETLSPPPQTEPSFLESLLNDAPETLPILRQSCIQVLNLTQDKRSSASDIGEAIMRDQALMANVVKIANSTAFHTRVPVKTPTHAVALIGFDVMQAMVVTAQLIEQANGFGADTTHLKHLLARALVAGTAAQELGKAMNYQEPGFLFTNAMLYSLGDFILALCRPEIAEELETLRLTDPLNVPKAELSLLGRPLTAIAAAMAKHWHLPENLIQLLEKKPRWPRSRPETEQQIMAGIVRASNELSYCLLNPSGAGQETIFQDLIKQFLPPFSISFPQLEQAISHAFMQASAIASTINIPQQHLHPKPLANRPSIQNTQFQKLTHIIEKALHTEDPRPHTEPSPPEENQVSPPPTTDADQVLMDFALDAMKISDPSKLLTFATRMLHESYGFERVLLAFVVPGKEKLEAKICYGPNADLHQSTFQGSLTPGPFWQTTLNQYQPLEFAGLRQACQTNETPQEFLEQWGESTGLIGTLHAPNKPIGIILADRGISHSLISKKDFAVFSLVLSQTNTNLARLAQS